MLADQMSDRIRQKQMLGSDECQPLWPHRTQQQLLKPATLTPCCEFPSSPCLCLVKSSHPSIIKQFIRTATLGIRLQPPSASWGVNCPFLWVLIIIISRYAAVLVYSSNRLNLELLFGLGAALLRGCPVHCRCLILSLGFVPARCQYPHHPRCDN